MDARVRELTIAAKSGNLAAVAEFIGNCCRHWHVDEQTLFEIQLAVDEATTNVIEHAYASAAGDITLRCWEDEGDFYIDLYDQGQPFDPAAVPPPTLTGPLSARANGGLGLYFMRQMMDEVSFQFEAEGNRLRMVRRGVAS